MAPPIYGKVGRFQNSSASKIASKIFDYIDLAACAETWVHGNVRDISNATLDIELIIVGI
jgi:hypothetical protein